MKLGMTGSRDGMSNEAMKCLKEFLDNNNIESAHHGDSVGADAMFHKEVVSRKIKTIIYPPEKDIRRAFCEGDVTMEPKPYLQRDHDIVDETDQLIAFPPTDHEILRSGTWATVRYARKKKRRILLVFPDGTTKKENY